MALTQFLVNKNNIHEHQISQDDVPVLGDGDVLLKVDTFAFTANNVTYAAFGDAMKYWDFFPVQSGMGCVPVWGFADVIESRCEDVQIGDRYYGYYPMASHLKVSPTKTSALGFFDASPHRAHLSAVYNFYTNCAGDPGYNNDTEALQMIFKPLFMTSFLIDDFLDDNGFFGAEQVVLSSASSKTAYGLAFLLARRTGIKVIGLTSSGNIDFVESMGSYDTAVTYDEVSKLNPNVPTVYVDMAGSGDVRNSVHEHFSDNLKYSCSVGASHWDQMGSNKDLPGAKPTLFFAPAQAKKRSEDWGQAGLQKRSAEAWIAFISKAANWTEIIQQSGEKAITDIYGSTVEGTVNPKHGNILSF